MKTDNTVLAFHHRDEIDDPLTCVLRDGARRLLAPSGLAALFAALAFARARALAFVMTDSPFRRPVARKNVNDTLRVAHPHAASETPLS